MAQTAKQRAASKRNIKKAQAALRRKRGGGRKRSSKRTTKKASRKRTTRRVGPGLAAVTAAVALPAPRPRKRRAAKRRPAKRRARRARAAARRRSTARVVRPRGTQMVVIAPQPSRRSSPRRRSAPKRRKSKRSKSRRRAMLENPLTLSTLGAGVEPGYMSLFENPVGPFSMGSVRALGAAAAGIGIGLVIAEATDRWVATRGNKHPWFGRDAAAAQQSRPDAMRLGVQAAGAAVGMAGAYYARGRGFLPWLLGGVAVGFASNLVRMGLNYYVMPAILTVENPTDKTLANRLYPLEQTKIQDKVVAFLDARTKGQQSTIEQYTPTSPLDPTALPPGEGVVYLGKGRKAPEQGNGLGTVASKLVSTGRLGKCGGCGGNGGCYTSCPDLKLCGECGTDNPTAMRCTVTVEAGTDVVALAVAAGVDIEAVNALNGGGDPSTYWAPGARVELPYALCTYLQSNPNLPDQGPIATPALAYATVAGVNENEAILYRNGA